MKILALDISSTSTGHCIIEDGMLVPKTKNKICPDSKYSMAHKLSYFGSEIEKLIHKYKPDLIVQEDIFKGPSAIVFKTLSMFRGVVMRISWEQLGKDPISIMPSEARKLVGCGIKKEDAFEFIMNKYHFRNFDFDNNNDVADSIVLGLAYFILLTQPAKVKKVKRRKKKK